MGKDRILNFQNNHPLDGGLTSLNGTNCVSMEKDLTADNTSTIKTLAPTNKGLESIRLILST